MKSRSLATFSVIGILGILLALSLTLWMGCSDAELPSDPETAALGAPPQHALDRVMAVQDRNTARMMAIRGVVGTATGLDATGRPAVLVLTERAGVQGIPRIVDSTPVVVKVTGKISALKKPDGPPGQDKPDPEPEPDPDPVDPTARFDRPVPIGVSTGHPDITAGTIGCRVKKDGNVYALSNNHVYADENAGPLNISVLQPGPFDGGGAGDEIGTLTDFEPIDFSGKDNTIDAAIAECLIDGDTDEPLVGMSTPLGGYGTPKSASIAARIRMRVMKYGRTTGQTKGKIYAINATVDVGYDSGVARFVDQIIVTPGGFSAGGDSGSLVVTDDRKSTRQPVGLLFAGSSLVTIANPIDLVLDRFGVTVDGE